MDNGGLRVATGAREAIASLEIELLRKGFAQVPEGTPVEKMQSKQFMLHEIPGGIGPPRASSWFGGSRGVLFSVRPDDDRSKVSGWWRWCDSACIAPDYRFPVILFPGNFCEPLTRVPLVLLTN